MNWVFSILDQSFHKQNFDCGKPTLNDYLKKYALQNMKKGYSITFVVTTAESREIVGYYCTSASTIEFVNLPESLKKGLPKYPAPAMLIGQLAVDRRVQGQGLGEILLIHSLNRAIRVSQEMAIFAVRVDALDIPSKNFYLKYGFVPFQDVELSLLLPMKTILASRLEI